MATTKLISAISVTSPATATTATDANSTTVDISDLDWFQVYLEVQGATGGTLDVWIQARIGDTWVDWYKHGQLAAAAGAEKRVIVPESTTIVTTVGTGTSPALAAGYVCGAHPGDALRFMFTSGAGTSAGAAQVMKVIGFKS